VSAQDVIALGNFLGGASPTVLLAVGMLALLGISFWLLRRLLQREGEERAFRERLIVSQQSQMDRQLELTGKAQDQQEQAARLFEQALRMLERGPRIA
jgi:hypothetical protein